MIDRSPVSLDPRQQIAANLAAIRQRIAAVCNRTGRDPGQVRLLSVSKTVPSERLRLAFAAGCTELGENKVQEALEKSQELADLPIRWCLIGHLQTNKAKFAARFAHEFQALDSLRLAEALDRRLQIEGRELDVFVQVNSSGETSKFGLQPDAVPAFVDALRSFSSLRPRGLMTLALHTSDPAAIRACFRSVRQLREIVCQESVEGSRYRELSMGMSGDFELAIEEGASVVRIGQAIFGARELPDGHYWPEAGANNIPRSR